MSEQATALSAEVVLRDDGYDGFVKALFSRSNDRSKDFAHAVLGVATEVTELIFAKDEGNGLEETGDLRFYGQAVINLVEEFSGGEFDYELADREYEKLVALGEVEGSEDSIDKARADLLDIAKRWVGYGKEPEDLLAAGAKAIALVQFTTAHARFGVADADKVELANVEKLLLRYKGKKFDAANAVNRDLDAERAVFTKSS